MMLLIIGTIICVGYGLPTIIALLRGHGYTGVIFALNLFGGWTGIGWLVALVWAVWPTEKSLIDPVVGNVTGTGIRNAGDSLGAANFGMDRGHSNEAEAFMGGPKPQKGTLARSASDIEQLEKLAALRATGVLNEQEFQTAKIRLLANLG